MRRALSLVGGIALGLVLAQFPEYAQQYEQRLGGAVDELAIIIADFDRGAADAGLSREAAIARYGQTGDSFITGRGQSMTVVFQRYERLTKALVDLDGAGPLQRLAHLPDYLDSDVGARALKAYKPAMPVTIEGLAWGGAGVLIGYAVLSALIRLVLLPLRWRRGALPARARERA